MFILTLLAGAVGGLGFELSMVTASSWSLVVSGVLASLSVVTESVWNPLDTLTFNLLVKVD